MKNLNELVPVDYSNQRVLTTAQVADVFDTDVISASPKSISSLPATISR